MMVKQKKQPNPSYKISPLHPQPEAKPSLKDQINTDSELPHFTSQHPHIYEDGYMCHSHKVKFNNNQATPVERFTPRNDISCPTYVPYPMSPNFSHCSSYINDFIRCFVHHELVAPGLLEFNDQPQSYRAWKHYFQNTTSGLDLTPSEDIDFLLKWLRIESAEHVEQVRAIHIHYPGAGLEMIWGSNRLMAQQK